MLRLLHTADVHLGARHADLGEQAAAQRERQFAAFGASVDLAIAEQVDLFLIAGDLFDSNTQPRRSVERVAAELRRLARPQIRDGDHPRHARLLRPLVDLPRPRPGRPRWRAADGRHARHVLTPDRPDVDLPSLDAVVYGRVFDTKRAPPVPLPAFDCRAADARATWHIGMIHGSLSIPGIGRTATRW